MRDDYPELEKLNSALLRMMQAGLLGHWYLVMLQIYERMYYRSLALAPSSVVQSQDRTDKTLSLAKLGIAFTVLGIGIGSSVLCFGLEVIVKRRSDSCR